MTNTEKLSSLIRHIKLVENNCNIISRKMIDTNPQFAIDIAKRGRIHDASKFDKIEFEHLWWGSKCFDVALLHHHCHNSHHPEHFHNGIYGMSDLDICEMVCDTTGRAQEFGTDVRIWLLDKAADKYVYKNDSKLMEEIEMYINLLLNESFVIRN